MTGEIIQMIIAAILGGGLWQLVTWRIRKRKLKAEIITHQYRDMEAIVDSYLQRMTDMADKIVELQEENTELQRLINLKEETNEKD